jgi:arylformamidase
MIDITIPVREGLAVWPGDTPYRLTRNAWGAITVGAATLSLHTGTHADAPRHFLPDGDDAAMLPLEVFVGTCRVVDVVGKTAIGPECFAPLDLSMTPRVLLKTLAWTDHTVFPPRVPTLTPAAVAHLRRAAVRLVGVDVPSVDAIDSTDLPIHHALAAAGIHILESLDLRAVPPGEYTLIALPLRLDDADGSPVRAVLR